MTDNQYAPAVITANISQQQVSRVVMSVPRVKPLGHLGRSHRVLHVLLAKGVSPRGNAKRAQWVNILARPVKRRVLYVLLDTIAPEMVSKHHATNLHTKTKLDNLVANNAIMQTTNLERLTETRRPPAEQYVEFVREDVRLTKSPVRRSTALRVQIVHRESIKTLLLGPGVLIVPQIK